MARPSNKSERRQQIAHALITVMAQRGYDGASVAQIAAQAGLATGLVHYHFTNKEEILLAALDELERTQRDGLEDAVGAASDSSRDQLAAFIDFHLHLGQAQPDALSAWLVITGEAMRRPEVRASFEAAVDRRAAMLAGIIERGSDAGAFDCTDSRVAAAAILSAIQGFLLLGTTAPSLVPLGSAAMSVRAMADGLLGAAR